MSACTNQTGTLEHFDKKPAEKIYPLRIIDLEEFGILRPFNFVQINDSVFVIQDNKAENIFNLINLSSKKIAKGVNKGQGPYDVIAPSSLLYRNNKVLVWDAMNTKMSELVLSSDTSLVIEEYYRVNTEISVLFRINHLDSTFIASVRSEEFWLAEMNKDGTIFSTIDYPIRDETKDIPRIMLSILYSGSVRMSNSPDGKRVVAASGSQGVLCFMDRTDSGIKEYKQIKYQAPVVAIDPRGQATYTTDNINGFEAVESDDNYVYALYSGRTYIKYKMKSNDCEHLLVYDWEGNPVRRYILDVPIRGEMRYDKEKNRIYGLADNPEGVLIVYQL